MIPVLRTSRLVLRGWRDEDLEPMARIYADPENVRFIGDASTATFEETEEWLRRAKVRWEQEGFGMWAVENGESGTLVGRAGLSRHALFPEEVEAGYLLDKPWWGRGLATEAAAAAIRWGFEFLGAPRMIAVAYPENIASRRVLEKLGFALQGERDDERVRGGRVVWYSREREPRPATS